MRRFVGFLPSASALCLLPACLLLNSNVRAQNGVTASEVPTTITGASAVDAMWADGNDHRWKVNNNNNNGTNGADIAIWPCTGSSQQGGITYAGTVPTGGSVNLENCLSLPSPAVLGVPLLVGSSTPQWGAENVDIGNYALAVEVNTNATTPTQYKLVIFTGAPTTVTIAATSSTTEVEGICVGNCSSSIAQIAREGVAGCIFDNMTTAGDYVQASTSSGGECHDTGSSTYPTNGKQVMGRTLASNTMTPPQNVNVMLYPSGIWTQLPLSGTGANYQTTNISGSTTSGHVVTLDANGNTQDGGTALSSLAPKASPTFTGTVTYPLLATTTACASAASPASCGASPAGSVVIATSATTVVVDTSAVTSVSQIFISFDQSLGSALSVTCNTNSSQAGQHYYISARTAGTSFTITTSSAPSTNPVCLSYFIVN